MKNIFCLRLPGQPDVLAGVDLDLKDVYSNMPQFLTLEKPHSLVPVQNGMEIGFRLMPYNVWDHELETVPIMQTCHIVSISVPTENIIKAYLEATTSLLLSTDMTYQGTRPIRAS